MKFDVTAMIKEIGEIETIGAKGFQKRNLILTEQSGQYENLICIEFSGDKLAAPEQFKEGQMVTVAGFINCREWNGKYFTSLRGSFINPVQSDTEAPYPQEYPGETAYSQQAPQMVTPAPSYPQPAPSTQPSNNFQNYANEDEVPF